jgi:hypothetical protein
VNEIFQQAHKEAYRRFKSQPSKCYQRHIREVWGELESKPTIPSLKGARVERITRQDAEKIILKYEWLAGVGTASPMGRGISAYYGLKLDGEILGASCWGRMGGAIGNICGLEYANQTVCLMRGACVPHAPDNSASFFTRNACRQAYKDFGWEVVFAYSDTMDAGEMGTVYQACGWYFLGEGIGSNVHTDFISPDGSRKITSYQLNHQNDKYSLMRSLGWTPEDGAMRSWLDFHGWVRKISPVKKKWAWFEGPNREELKSKCRHPFLPYPKRNSENSIKPSSNQQVTENAEG